MNIRTTNSQIFAETERFMATEMDTENTEGFFIVLRGSFPWLLEVLFWLRLCRAMIFVAVFFLGYLGAGSSIA